MQDSNVPIEVWTWVLAAVPLVLLLFLLIFRRWKAPEAGPVALFVATGVALLAFRTPMETAAVAAAKGIWDAIFILYVVWPALLLYRVIDGAGAFEAVRKGVLRFSKNELFLVLGFGWVFASFLQGITGFGTPIAVVAPLLVALGVKPLYAVAIPLIGHAWANLFGTLGVAWLATQQVIDLRDPTTTAVETAALLWIPNLFAGLAIAWLFARGRGVTHALPLVLIISVIHGGGQLLLSAWNPVLANFIPTTIALLALYPLSHWPRYSNPFQSEKDSPVMQQENARDEEEAEPEPVMGIGMAIVPYVFLTFVAVATLTVPFLESTLERFQVGLPFPEVTTGYGLTNEAADAYSAFTPLTHPGTFLLLASLAGWLLYRSKHFYEKWREESNEEQPGILAGMAKAAIPASLAIVTFLTLSKVMDHSGQTEALALGLAAVAPAAVYAFFASWIGLLGAFMTSSNASSNIIFAPLQQTVAEVEAIDESTVIAAQHAGAAVGNSISPANVVLGTGAANIVGQEGRVLRTVLPYAAASTIAVGVGTLVLMA